MRTECLNFKVLIQKNRRGKVSSTVNREKASITADRVGIPSGLDWKGSCFGLGISGEKTLH